LAVGWSPPLWYLKAVGLFFFFVCALRLYEQTFTVSWPDGDGIAGDQTKAVWRVVFYLYVCPELVI